MLNLANLEPHTLAWGIAIVGAMLVLKRLFHKYRLNDPFYRLRQLENARIVIDHK